MSDALGNASKRRVGRPLKESTGKRAQLSVLIRPDLLRAIREAAERNGRTQSQEAEHWLERLLVLEAVLDCQGAG